MKTLISIFLTLLVTIALTLVVPILLVVDYVIAYREKRQMEFVMALREVPRDIIEIYLLVWK